MTEIIMHLHDHLCLYNNYVVQRLSTRLVPTNVPNISQNVNRAPLMTWGLGAIRSQLDTATANVILSLHHLDAFFHSLVLEPKTFRRPVTKSTKDSNKYFSNACRWSSPRGARSMKYYWG
jgi:hypothetical protein